MTIEYKVEVFKTNDPTLSPHHIIYDIRYSMDTMGIIHTHFRTLEKYYDVRDGGALNEDGEFSELIEISPFIFDEDYRDIADYDAEKYYNHPDWFLLILEIKTPFFDDNVIPVITPEKFEYHVAHIPIDYALGHGLKYTPTELMLNIRNSSDV